MDKRYKNIAEALKGILFDGMSIMSGGFGLCGIPENAIQFIKDSKVKNLTIISNNLGVDDFGLGLICQTGQVKKVITSFLGANKFVEKAMINKEIEVELTPQGTLAARIRSAGAGIPAFYTPTGFGTCVMDGKEVRYFDNEHGRKQPYLMEHALHADLAIIKGHHADKFGNIIYRKAAQNFNPIMAAASKYAVAEVEKIVDPSEIDPDHVHTPGIFVDRIVECSFEKRIERRTTVSNPNG